MISVIKLWFSIFNRDFVYFIDKVFRIYLVSGVYWSLRYFLNKVNGM